MIRFDEINLSNSTKDEITSFINQSLEKAYQAIDYFFNYLEIDISLFSHLKKIPIIIDNNDNFNMAAYFMIKDHELNEPAIHLVYTYINNVFNVSKKDKFINYSISQLAWTILHEIIHCNRCILLNNLISIEDTNIIFHGNPNKFRNTYNELEELLSKTYEETTTKKSHYILKISIDDKYYDVFTYNEKEDSYELFLINKDYIDGKDILSEINSFILFNYNNSYSFNEPYAKIKRINTYNEEDIVMNFDYDSNNINIPFDVSFSNEEKRKISLHEGLEESITEVFAGLIIIMNNNRSLNLYEVCDVLKQEVNNYDIQLAIELVKNMSLDDIRWFFLSCYLDEYENRFKKIIKYDYIRLLECFDILYKNTNNKSSEYKEILEEGKNIIHRNVSIKSLKK